MVVSGALSGGARADVAVVGSGIAGLSAAFHLERAGYDVLVLEEERVAGGATRYSSGVLYFGSGTEFADAIRLWGRGRAKALWDASKQSIDGIVSLVEKNAWGAGLRESGSVMVARDAGEVPHVEAEARAMQELGYPGTLLDEAEVRGYYAGAGFARGLFQPVCYQIKPGLFADALAKSLRARVVENTPMTEIAEEKDGVVVKTPRGDVRAQHAVLATNLKPAFGLERHWVQESSAIVASAELGGKQASVWPRDVVVWTPGEGYDVWYAQDGRAHFEAYSLEGAEEKVRRYFPEFVSFDFGNTRGDAWSKTRDWLPIVGSVRGRVHVAVAMGDQGIVMGWAAGRDMPGVLAGKKSAFLDMATPGRFGVGP